MSNLFLVLSSRVLRLMAGGVPSKTKMGRMLCLLRSMILLRIDFIFYELVVMAVSILTIQIEASIASILP